MCSRLEKLGIATAVLANLDRFGFTNFGHRVARKLYPSHRRVADWVAGHRTYRVWNLVDEIDAVLNSFPATIAVVQEGGRPELVDLFTDRGIPVLWYHHSVTWDPIKPVKRNPLMSVLACSQFVADRFKADQGHNVQVVPPLIEVEDYRTATTRQEVLFVNPRPAKGSDIAWALAEAMPDIQFRFLEAWSPGPARQSENRRRAEVLGNVVVERSRSDMRSFYARGKVLLAPSRCLEAFGRVVSEAQVSGIPVICSDRGGLPEAAGPGGIILPIEDDATRWVEALRLLWNDSALYQHLSDAALRHAQRPDFAPEQITRNFLGHLERRIGASAMQLNAAE